MAWIGKTAEICVKVEVILVFLSSCVKGEVLHVCNAQKLLLIKSQ
jgi:hypothetical protein